jgi:hypothetical protein
MSGFSLRASAIVKNITRAGNQTARAGIISAKAVAPGFFRA